MARRRRETAVRRADSLTSSTSQRRSTDTTEPASTRRTASSRRWDAPPMPTASPASVSTSSEPRTRNCMRASWPCESLLSPTWSCGGYRQGRGRRQAHALAHDLTVDISTTGRRGGEPRRIEIWLLGIDDRSFITGTSAASRADVEVPIEIGEDQLGHVSRGERSPCSRRAASSSWGTCSSNRASSSAMRLAVWPSEARYRLIWPARTPEIVHRPSRTHTPRRCGTDVAPAPTMPRCRERGRIKRWRRSAAPGRHPISPPGRP